MPGGEWHYSMGVGLQLIACGPEEITWPIIPATLLAVATHWTDDWNKGLFQLKHDLGKGWRKAIYLTFRGLAICGLIYLTYLYPLLLICGLSAWVVFDHEWPLKWLKLPRIHMHAHMWPAWTKTQWVFIPKICSLFLILAIMPWRGV